MVSTNALLICILLSSESSGSTDPKASQMRRANTSSKRNVLAPHPHRGPSKMERYESSRCVEDVRKRFLWARFVIFLGLLALVWGAVGFVYFCMPVRVNVKVFVIFGAVLASLVWFVMSLTAESTMFVAFYYTTRSMICDN